jgi:Uma2 family endonuclease
MPHDIVLNRISLALFLYSASHGEVLSYVSTHGRVFLLDPPEGITAPEPDIAGYTKSFPEGTPAAEMDWRKVSPAFVVEILSEDTEDKDLERNRRLYVQVPSIQEYWVVDPRASAGEPMMLVYRRRGRRWAARLAIAAGATYTTPILPGFSLLLDPLT